MFDRPGAAVQRIRITLSLQSKGESQMKKTRLFNIVLLLVVALFVQASLAQTAPGGHTLNLPEGAKARLGKGWISEIAYSPDGTRLAVGSAPGIWLYDTQTGEELSLLTGHTDVVRSVSFSRMDRPWQAGVLTRPSVYGNVGTGRVIRTLTGHTSWVLSVSFSPDGQTLASGSDDETIRLWDVGTGRVIRTLTGHTYRVRSVSFSPDGQTLASGSDDDTIRLWDVGTGRVIRTLTGHTSWVMERLV